MSRPAHPRPGIAQAAALVTALALAPAAHAEKIKLEYEVKKGDSLAKIAERHGVTIEQILKWNDHIEKKPAAKEGEDLTKVSLQLRPGMELKLPGKPSGKSGTITYKVEKGDSLWSIGKKFHVKQSVIIKWNGKKLGTKQQDPGPEPLSVEEAAKHLVPGMKLKVPGKPSGHPEKVVHHKVEKGDSLWSIGKKYHVKPSVLVKWNDKKLGGNGAHEKGKAGSVPVIHPGMKLVIHAFRPDLGPRVAVLRVKPGDSTKKVAKRYDVPLKTLLEANFLLANDMLRVGDTLEVPLPVTQKDTQSVGAPHAGKLLAGERMPDGPGYTIKQPGYAWGTSETISWLITCIGSVQGAYKNTHDLVVGHISKKTGGNFKPHKSHASGRDVDVGYYLLGTKPKQFVKIQGGNLDIKRTSHFIECLVDSGRTQYIFINTYIQKTLYSSFKSRGFGAEFLTKAFQYPQPEGKQLGIIRHEKGHDDHMHVRFVCPEGDTKCHD